MLCYFFVFAILSFPLSQTLPTQKIIGGGSHDIGHMGMFKTFMKQHNKTYKNKAEFKKRFRIFHQNMKKAHILQQNERGTAKYGPTKFADLTGEWAAVVTKGLTGYRCVEG